jgi:hypothetical protein
MKALGGGSGDESVPRFAGDGVRDPQPPKSSSSLVSIIGSWGDGGGGLDEEFCLFGEVLPFPRRELIDRRALSLLGADGVFFSGSGRVAWGFPPFSFSKNVFEGFLFAVS